MLHSQDMACIAMLYCRAHTLFLHVHKSKIFTILYSKIRKFVDFVNVPYQECCTYDIIMPTFDVSQLPSGYITLHIRDIQNGLKSVAS